MPVPRVPLDHPATYDDLIALPDHLVAEIVDGELHASPRPAPRHAFAHSALGMVLGPPFAQGRSGPGGWRIIDEPELHLGPDVVVPDLAGWRRERMPRLPRTAFFPLTPDWLCEVLSPSTESLDRTKKVAVYARAHVPHLWLVRPNDQTLEAMVLQAGQWVTAAVHRGPAVVRIPPFDAIEIDLSLVWDTDGE